MFSFSKDENVARRKAFFRKWSESSHNISLISNHSEVFNKDETDFINPKCFNIFLSFFVKPKKVNTCIAILKSAFTLISITKNSTFT